VIKIINIIIVNKITVVKEAHLSVSCSKYLKERYDFQLAETGTS